MSTDLPENYRFPQNYLAHPRAKALFDLVKEVNEHPALCTSDENILANVIQSSLVFTICFYGHALTWLRNVAHSTSVKHPFAVEENTTKLGWVLTFASGEIATDNIPTSKVGFTPHYVAMSEAATEAGVAVEPVRRFINELNSGKSVQDAADTADFVPPLAEYLVFSGDCLEHPEHNFATLALRELILPVNFQVIVDALPLQEKYLPFRRFLEAHISLDTDEHGEIMIKQLEESSHPESILDVMIVFLEKRKAVYDACLTMPQMFESD